MAGYLFGLDNIESLQDCITRGVYSTILSPPSRSNLWMIHHEGTFADYCSMKEGDNVYFFIERKIYGIGSLVNINGECKFLNYPGSNEPTVQNYIDIQDDLLLDIGEVDEISVNSRFICTFEPHPVFFTNGIDMDEVLASAPAQFKVLRAFWKLSFIKFSDEENQAFKNILLRRNIEGVNAPDDENIFPSEHEQMHEAIRRKTLDTDEYDLSIAPFLYSINNENGSIRHEMAVEAALIYQLAISHLPTIDVFGAWDHLTHQVVASPFKPIDYMDKMDVFGYKFVIHQKPTVERYLVIEVKKGRIEEQDVFQLMKYVDWVKNEYAYNDYSMIDAFMVGYEYSDESIGQLSQIAERKFIRGVRPSEAAEWRNVKLVTYEFNEETNLLDFNVIADANE